MKIAIDIDGTITRADAFIPFINNAFQTEFRGEDITSYDFGKALGVDVSVIFDTTDDTMYRSLPARPFASTVIQTLTHDEDVHIVTARHTWLAPATQDWLSAHRIPVGQMTLHGGDKKKKKFLLDLRPDVVIEDNPGIAAFAVEELGVPVFLLDTPYNQECTLPGIHRVADWYQLDYELAHLIAQSRKRGA